MTGETRAQVSGWTIDTLAAHIDTLLEMQSRFDGERDRRYTEVADQREKALKIKETADLTALQLAREIQTYKDEKANQLREQINQERGLYASKDDLAGAVAKLEETLKPLASFMAAQQGRSAGLNSGWVWILGALGALSTLASVGALFAGVIVYLSK